MARFIFNLDTILSGGTIILGNGIVTGSTKTYELEKNIELTELDDGFNNSNILSFTINNPTPTVLTNIEFFIGTISGTTEDITIVSDFETTTGNTDVTNNVNLYQSFYVQNLSRLEIDKIIIRESNIDSLVFDSQINIDYIDLRYNNLGQLILFNNTIKLLDLRNSPLIDVNLEEIDNIMDFKGSYIDLRGNDFNNNLQNPNKTVSFYLDYINNNTESLDFNTNNYRNRFINMSTLDNSSNFTGQTIVDQLNDKGITVYTDLGFDSPSGYTNFTLSDDFDFNFTYTGSTLNYIYDTDEGIVSGITTPNVFQNISYNFTNTDLKKYTNLRFTDFATNNPVDFSSFTLIRMDDENDIQDYLDMSKFINVKDFVINEQNNLENIFLPNNPTIRYDRLDLTDCNIDFINLEDVPNFFNVDNSNFRILLNNLTVNEVESYLTRINNLDDSPFISGFTFTVLYFGRNIDIELNSQPTVFTTGGTLVDCDLTNTSKTLPLKPLDTESDNNWQWNTTTLKHDPISGGATINELLNKDVTVRTNDADFTP